MKPIPLTRVRRDVRRAVYARRRLLAAACAGLAVVLGLDAVAPPRPETTAVVVAAHDLRAGQVLAGDDLNLLRRPPDTVPSGAVTSVEDSVGRTLAAPMRGGEALTDLRLLQPSLLEGYPDDHVLTVVRVADPTTADLVHHGDRVDVLAVDAHGESDLVAAGAFVVSVDRAETDGMATSTGTGVVVAVPTSTAGDLAAAGALGPLTLTVTLP